MAAMPTGNTPEERAKLIAKAIHIVANGGLKITKTMGIPKRASSLLCVSTSNDSLSSLLKGSQASRGALAARLVTISLPVDRLYGVLTRLPMGYTASGQAIDALNAAMTTQHGTPIRHFIAALVKARHDDEKALIADLRKYHDLFLKAVGIDRGNGHAYRRARPFGLAYAVSRLARRWGTLPHEKVVGNYLEAFKLVWSWTHASQPKTNTTTLSGSERLRAYVEHNRQAFKKTNPLKAMSAAAFRKCPGFVKAAKGGGTELVMSPARFRKEFDFDRKTVAELIAKGILLGEKGRYKRNDTKRKVRLDDEGDSIDDDRVYVILLAKLGIELPRKASTK